MTNQALAVIPARYDSQRLPGKALADICGLPMVVRVARRVEQASRVRRVVVATDDERIARVVRAHGSEAVMTRTHRSGTDRVAEAARGLGMGPGELVVNVQGDEPLVRPQLIDALIDTMVDGGHRVATAAAPLSAEAAQRPERVKVVTDRHGRALYFSRAPIPHGGPWWVHHGIYAFRFEALQAFVELAPSALERTERLEQLRLLDNGISIQVIETSQDACSVDTPADLARVRQILQPGPPR